MTAVVRDLLTGSSGRDPWRDTSSTRKTADVKKRQPKRGSATSNNRYAAPNRLSERRTRRISRTARSPGRTGKTRSAAGFHRRGSLRRGRRHCKGRAPEDSRMKFIAYGAVLLVVATTIVGCGGVTPTSPSQVTDGFSPMTVNRTLGDAGDVGIITARLLAGTDGEYASAEELELHTDSVGDCGRAARRSCGSQEFCPPASSSLYAALCRLSEPRTREDEGARLIRISCASTSSAVA